MVFEISEREKNLIVNSLIHVSRFYLKNSKESKTERARKDAIKYSEELQDLAYFFKNPKKG